MSLSETHSRLNWHPFKPLLSALSRLRPFSSPTDCGGAEDCARRRFILDMMDAHPDAFQHELNCQTIMKFYPSRF